MTHRFRLGLALACAALPFAALLSPAYAAAALPAAGVSLPWGDWLTGACSSRSPPSSCRSRPRP